MSSPLDDPEAYAAFSPDTPCTLIFMRGAIAFRFGPFPAGECGPHMEKALALDVPMAISFDCGKEIDWTMVADFFGKVEGEVK